MESAIRILHLEDNPADAVLVREALKRGGLAVELLLAKTRREFLAALDQGTFELCLSDYALPELNGLEALRLTRAKRPGVPFLFLSGSIGEGAVVELMRCGATDFISKGHLGRLGPAVKRALEETARDRRLVRAEGEAVLAAGVDERARLGSRFLAALFKDESDEVYGEALHVALAALGSRVGHFGYIREADGALVCPRARQKLWPQGQTEGQTVVYPRESWAGAWGRILQERRSDYQNAAENSTPAHAPIRRFLGAPILHQGHLIGSLYVANREADYGPADAELLEYLASVAAPVVKVRLEKYGLEEERRKAVEEKSRIEAQLQQAQKLECIGQLAGGVAHDFNNILSVVLGYSQMALNKLPEGDPQRKRLETVVRAGERGAALARQLLIFSRKQEIQPKVVNLNVVISDFEKLLRRLIGEDVVLDLKLTSEPWNVRVDPGQIEQVIMNLAINARDAMPSGGHVCIETASVDVDEDYVRTHPGTQPGAFVRLTVSDTGCGMSSAIQQRVFEPFFTTKAPGKGTGLGLSVVYGIVRQSNGFIGVYSEVGKGSSFKVYLPRADSAKDPLAAKSNILPATGEEVILAVDDDREILEMVRETLVELGYQVLAAHGPQEALAAAAAHKGLLHLLVTDFVMPHMNGLELASHLRVLRPTLRILYMSGYSADSMVQQGIMSRSVGYMEKPLTPLLLARKVRETLDAPA